jgi:hypothetical protein
MRESIMEPSPCFNRQAGHRPPCVVDLSVAPHSGQALGWFEWFCIVRLTDDVKEKGYRPGENSRKALTRT